MARRYYAWTTAHFDKYGGVRFSNYRRYGNKTYKIGRTWGVNGRQRSIVKSTVSNLKKYIRKYK